jgi:hypothetical protein
MIESCGEMAVRTRGHYAARKLVSVCESLTLSRLSVPVGIEAHFQETFEKCSILFKFKEGEDFNRRNTSSILRIEI